MLRIQNRVVDARWGACRGPSWTVGSSHIPSLTGRLYWRLSSRWCRRGPCPSHWFIWSLSVFHLLCMLIGGLHLRYWWLKPHLWWVPRLHSQMHGHSSWPTTCHQSLQCWWVCPSLRSSLHEHTRGIFLGVILLSPIRSLSAATFSWLTCFLG